MEVARPRMPAFQDWGCASCMKTLGLWERITLRSGHQSPPHPLGLSGHPESVQDFRNQLFGSMRHLEGQGVLGLFEVSELAGQNGFTSEVAVAGENVLAHLF